MRFITSEIWKRFQPHEMDMDIYFRRPIFWDDTVELMVDEAADSWSAVCLVKEGKVCTEAKIKRIA